MTERETLYWMFRKAAEQFDKPDALASKRGGDWQPISHASMVERVRALSLGLHMLGVQRGDRVALMSESRPEWTLTDLATLGVCGAAVPIYPTLTAEQAAYVIRDSGARLCVVSNAGHLAKIASVLPELRDLERVIVIDAEGVDRDISPDVNVDLFEEIEAMGRDRLRTDGDLPEVLAGAGRGEDLATLIYTSGTTGNQKGVMLTHGNFLANIEATFDEMDIFTPSDTALSFLPLSHIFERTAVYGFIRGGVSVYYAQSIDTVAQDLQDVQPTVMTSVPRLFEKIYARIVEKGLAAGGLKSLIFKRALKVGDSYARAVHRGRRVNPLVALEYPISDKLVFSKWRDALGGRVNYFISGGAPLSPDIAYAFLGAGVTILEGYGLTETSPVIAANRPGAHRIGTVGRPLDNLELRFDADGEILVKGPSIMQGYYNLPELNQEVFTEDGFFRTGDIGRLDEDGFLVITDRKKDLIKTSGGKYVAPQPIENKIKVSPLVAQVVVIGDRRKYCTALIVPNFETLGSLCASRGIAVGSREEMVRDPQVVRLYEEEVRTRTSDLAKWESIKRVGLLPHELTIESGEMTPTLKVKRRVVEDRYKELIDSLYSEEGERGVASHV